MASSTMEKSGKYESYLKYLPEIYSSGVDADFLEKFLEIFKNVLSERTTPGILEDFFPSPSEGIEEILDKIHEFFNPHLAPGVKYKGKENHPQRNFLNWLAEWVSFAYGVYFDEAKLRRIIPQLIPLYAKRGTREGFKEYIELFTGKNSVSIYETPLEKSQFTKYLYSQANKNFILENNYTFGVRIDLSRSILVKDYSFDGDNLPTPQEIEYIINLFNQIIAHEKPAHTDVILSLHVTNGIQIAVTSTIAEDTRIGFGVELVETTASFSLA